jgi:hypothetical protein
MPECEWRHRCGCRGGFGERTVRYSPSYDYVYSPLLYWLGERVYQRVAGLRVAGRVLM